MDLSHLLLWILNGCRVLVRVLVGRRQRLHAAVSHSVVHYPGGPARVLPVDVLTSAVLHPGMEQRLRLHWQHGHGRSPEDPGAVVPRDGVADRVLVAGWSRAAPEEAEAAEGDREEYDPP